MDSYVTPALSEASGGLAWHPSWREHSTERTSSGQVAFNSSRVYTDYRGQGEKQIRGWFVRPCGWGTRLRFTRRAEL